MDALRITDIALFLRGIFAYEVFLPSQDKVDTDYHEHHSHLHLRKDQSLRIFENPAEKLLGSFCQSVSPAPLEL
jgi:hypothetical protein